MKRLLVLAAAGLLCLACGEPGAPVPERPWADDTLAVYDGGVVTQRDVGVFLRHRPAADRTPGDRDRADWERDLVRELVAERLALEEVRDTGLTQGAELSARLAEYRRSMVIAIYLASKVDVQSPTEDELRAHFESARERYSRRESRRVFHLFLRRAPGQGSEELSARMSELREDIASGLPFAEVAGRFSDSESRHSGGELGWVGREDLAPAASDIVFSLGEGDLSEPVMTMEGAHLFLVSEVIEARSFAFGEVRSLIEAELDRQRREDAVQAVVASLPPLENHFRASLGEIRQLEESSSSDAVVLRVGDLEVTAARLWELVDAQSEHRDETPEDLAEEVLSEIEGRQRIYREAEKEGYLDDPEVERAVELQRERWAVEALRRRQVRTELENDPEALERFYDENRLRFAKPLRLLLSRLDVPLGSPREANRTMTRLEQARGRLEAGAVELGGLAEELGGWVTDLGWWTPGSPGRGPRQRLVQLVSPLEAGQVSPPFRTAEGMTLFLARDREEPRVPPFAEVREEVVVAYLERHEAELRRRVVDRILDEVSLRFRAGGSAREAS